MNDFQFSLGSFQESWKPISLPPSPRDPLLDTGQVVTLTEDAIKATQGRHALEQREYRLQIGHTLPGLEPERALELMLPLAERVLRSSRPDSKVIENSVTFRLRPPSEQTEGPNQTWNTAVLRFTEVKQAYGFLCDRELAGDETAPQGVPGQWTVPAGHQSLVELNRLPAEFDIRLAFELLHLLLEDSRSGPPQPAGLPANSENDTASSFDGFRHTPDYRSVNLNGETFTFTKLRAHIVRNLDTARLRGTPDLPFEECMRGADEGWGNPKSMYELFRGHPAWKTLIIPSETRGSKGLYRLNV